MQDRLDVVLVTGGFDPLHSGHIEYFKAARQLGDKLVVGINSDLWLSRKKGKPFMPITERVSVVENLKMVDHCLLYNDDDNSSIEAIKNVRQLYPDAHIIFANGGDRTKENIPEMNHKDDNLSFEFGVGGFNKANSSSWILEEWKNPKTIRPWGWYRILDDKSNYKVKELTVEPGKSLSMQKHLHRSELWFVAEGIATLNTFKDHIVQHVGDYTLYQYIIIENQDWHQLQNNQHCPLRIIEIQYGDKCVEEDIIRQVLDH